jgi:hypothetical protein
MEVDENFEGVTRNSRWLRGIRRRVKEDALKRKTREGGSLMDVVGMAPASVVRYE